VIEVVNRGFGEKEKNAPYDVWPTDQRIAIR